MTLGQRVLASATHMSEQACQSPFLSLHILPPWTRVVECAPELRVLNMTEHLQEIATRRHRLYFIRCTLRLQAQHYHIRIAGLLPARNKMLGRYRAIDPPCYRLVHIPQILRRVAAQLQDNTTVYPFASDRDGVFLSLSGIIFGGNTVDQRYVLHQHLVNLGLAGPIAPILQWAGHFQEGPLNTHVLPFHSWVVLPAELLAIPVPSASWAFEEEPVMSLREWEEYRRRSTSTVILKTTERNLNFFSQLAASVTGRAMPVIVGIWLMGRLLTSRLCGRSPGPVQQPSPLLVQLALPSLCNHAGRTGSTQGTEMGASSSRQSVQSSSTELRVAPPTVRGALVFWLHAFTELGWASVPAHISTAMKVHRPSVSIRGCIPKGHLAYHLTN